MSAGTGDVMNLETLRGRDYPSIRQFSIFSPNQVGQLQILVKRIETANLRVCALSVQDSADCAVIRLVVSEPERAVEVLEQAGFAYCEVDLLVVELHATRQPLMEICTTLLQGEINIFYCYPLLVSPHGRPAMAFHVENHEEAAELMRRKGLVVLTEADLEL